MAKTITRSEYLELVGLLTLAKRHNRMLVEIREAALGITGELRAGEPDDLGHTADAVYCDYSAAELCRRLGVEVPPSADAVDPVDGIATERPRATEDLSSPVSALGGSTEPPA